MNRALFATLVFLVATQASPSVRRSGTGAVGSEANAPSNETRGTARAAEPSDEVLQDSEGRETSRVHRNVDGSSQRTRTQYLAAGAVDRATETADPSGRVTAHLLERVDEGGRVSERREVKIDREGRESGRVLTYSYESDGRQRVHSKPIGDEGRQE